ncbi:MAG: 3'-5' exonuclease [Kiritimatiellales bacterium]|nr:3'-5' exonuclease [Kiritimatiellales bacterium]
MIPFFRKQESPVCQHYRAAAKPRLSKKTPVQDVRFVVLDIESSGLKVGQDRILSIALFEICNGQIDMGRSRKWIVFQPVTTPNASTAIHCILPSETRAGRSETEVLAELLPLLAGAVMVGHHVCFDAAMLSEAMMRNLKIKFLNPVIDTAYMAMREMIPFHRTGYGNQRPPSLDEVCAQLDLPVVARHTAEGDAFVAAEVFLFLCGKVRRRFTKRPLQLRDLPVEYLRSLHY